MTDIRTIIAELRELEAKEYQTLADMVDICNALPRILGYIARVDAVADAAEVVYAGWGEEEIACEFEEWRNLRSALDAADCDLKS